MLDVEGGQDVDAGVADRLDVHLLDRHAPVLDTPGWDDLKVADGGDRLSPVVGLDQADHDVDAFGLQPAGGVQHRVGLADARRGTEIDGEPTTLWSIPSFVL